MAEMRGLTEMAPLASIRMASGYSPAEAQEPCRRIWRVTMYWRGSGTSGWMLPMRGDSTALADAADGGIDGGCVAYGFKGEIEAAEVGALGDLLNQGFTGELEGLLDAYGLGHGETGGVDIGDEDFRAAGGAKGLGGEEADHAAPMTRAVWPCVTSATWTAWRATATASSMAASAKGRVGGRWCRMRSGTATNSAKAP